MPRLSNAATRSVLLRRAGAYVLDVTLLFVVLAPLGYVVQLAFGVDLSAPTAQGVYITLVLNFSLPAWTYFVLADHSRGGATLGKRLLSLCTQTEDGGRVCLGRALVRTAVKMVPWEIVHVSAFLFAPALGQLAVGNYIGIGASYILSFAYLFVAWRMRGYRSVHDFVASTCVTMVRK